MDVEINDLLELYTLDELFDVMDITPFEVITILVESGYVQIPDFLLRETYVDQEQEEGSTADEE